MVDKLAGLDSRSRCEKNRSPVKALGRRHRQKDVTAAGPKGRVADLHRMPARMGGNAGCLLGAQPWQMSASGANISASGASHTAVARLEGDEDEDEDIQVP